MPADRMPSELTIDRLVAGLAPVRPARPWRGVLALLVVAAVELALVIGMTPPRNDMEMAMAGPMLWWKIASSLLLAVAGTLALAATLVPDAPRKAGVRWMLGAAGIALVTGIAVTDHQALPAAMADTMSWREGLACIAVVEAYALPMLLAMLLVARRAAPAWPRATAIAAGVASAGWGAVAFAWRCPHDSAMYVLVWYGLAVVIGAGLALLVLPRFLRW